MKEETRYCNDCKRNVTPKKFSILTFWAMIFTGIVLTVAIIGWIIVGVDHEATVLQKHSNDPSLCILRMDGETEVNVIGKVDDFDLVNVRYDSNGN